MWFKLVWKLLAAFVEAESGSGQMLAALLSNGQLEQAQRKTNDLEGIAANLGLVGISKAGALLEQQIKQGLPADAALAKLIG